LIASYLSDCLSVRFAMQSVQTQPLSIPNLSLVLLSLTIEI